jgi:hypothetical protein
LYSRTFTKTLDYANITYEEINNKIVEVAGLNAFANLTVNYSNVDVLKDYLLSNLSNEEALLRGFNLAYLLKNHPTALEDMLTYINDEQYVTIFFNNNPNFNFLCNCLSTRKSTNPIEFNLKEALLHNPLGIDVLLGYMLQTNPTDLINLATDLGYTGSDANEAFEYVKVALFGMNEIDYAAFYTTLSGYIDFDNCSIMEIALNFQYLSNQPLVIQAITAISGIRDLFYGSSGYACGLRLNKVSAANLFASSYASLTWDALLMVQNTAYWLTWLRTNDPAFLYKASYYSPSMVSTYQTSINLYGGAYSGKQNYRPNN